jgi:hypothetical protein
MLFLFVCSAECTLRPAGGAFCAADKQKKRADKISKQIYI